MKLRNMWVTEKRTPKNLCKNCLLKANCSKFCDELSVEVLGDAIDRLGIGMQIHGLPRDMDVFVHSKTSAEVIKLSTVVKT